MHMTNLCSLFIKHVSRTTFMYSYRIPPQISGFDNIKSRYPNLNLLPMLYQYSGFWA